MRQTQATACSTWLALTGLALGAMGTARAAETLPATDPTAYVVGGGIENMQLSPDGTRVAGMVRTTEGVRALVSRKIDGSDQRIAYHLPAPGMDMALVRWLGNERFLLRVSSQQDPENGVMRYPITRLVVIGLNGDKPQVLSKPNTLGWVNHMSQEASPACPASTLVQVPSADEPAASAVLARFDAQAMRWLNPTQIPANARGLYTDAQGEVRLAVRSDPSNPAQVERLVPQEGSLLSRWKPWRAQALVGVEQVQELGVAPDGGSAYLLVEPKDAPAEVWRLPLDREDAEPQRLAQVSGALSRSQLVRHTESCEAVGLRAGGRLWTWADGLDRLVGGIQAQLPDRSVELLAWQGDRYLVRIGSPSKPTEHLFGTRSARSLQGLGSTHVALPVDLGLVERKLNLPGVAGGVTVLSQTGTTGPRPTLLCMDCRLDFNDAQGRFDALKAYWAQRGWAVAQADGASPGLRDTIRQTPQTLQRWQHVIDGLVAQGIAHRERVVAVALSSEAGRQALLLGSEPDKPLRAVATVGALSDLVAYNRQASDPRLTTGSRAAIRRLFDGLSPEDVRQRSPLHRAAEQQAAVLLIHPDHDAAVPLEHAEPFQRALQARQHPSSLRVLKDTGGQIDHPPYRVEVVKAIDQLFAPVLDAAI